MADIKVLKIDENKSHPSDSNPFYSLVLSAKPDQSWNNNFQEVHSRKRLTEVMNLRIEGNPGNVLTLNTAPGVSGEQMLQIVQGLLADTNAKEDAFMTEIQRLNEKLAAQTAAPN